MSARRHRSSRGADGAGAPVLDAVLARRLLRYVRPYTRLVLLSLLVLVGVSCAQLFQPILVRRAIDEHIRQGVLEGFLEVAVLFLFLLVAEFLLRFAQMYLLDRTGQNVVFDLRMHAFSHLQSLPSAYFDRNPVGRLMTRVTSDVEAINEAFTSGVVLMIADMFRLAGIVVILLWMDWRLALVTFAVLPPMLAVSMFFRSRIRGAHRKVRGMVARLNSFLQEHVVGMRLIQLFLRERESRNEFRNLNRRHRDAELRAVRYDSAFSAVAELFGSLTLAVIVWAGGWRILGEAMSFGTLVAFIQYAGKFFEPVQELSQRFAVMQSAMASSERIFELLDTETTIRSPADPHRLEQRPRGGIAFENVTFGYEKDLPVLRDVSFRIGPGERAAVVGWTGAGKSTLIRLLTRLYDVWEGRITLDGVDVREYDLADLRRNVGVVLQDPFLFTGTVEGNISLGDPAVSRDGVRRAAEAVHAHRFIENLPSGYGEAVRERGSNFSVGERQLLSFARALAFDPAVLVLDEATSSVDVETEREIRRAMEVVLRHRTSLIIAHRLATLEGAERILVMHRGRLVEEGTHAELIGVENGLYRTLYELQV